MQCENWKNHGGDYIIESRGKDRGSRLVEKNCNGAMNEICEVNCTSYSVVKYTILPFRRTRNCTCVFNARPVVISRIVNYKVPDGGS